MHGSRDWAAQAPTATIFQLPDMGELAVRLGSIDRFDRRGNVVFMDDFESGLSTRWSSVFSAPGDAPAIYTSTARSGLCSCRIQSPGTGVNPAYILHQEPLPVLSRLGLEMSFSFSKALGALTSSMAMYDGVNVHRASARYLPETEEVQVITTGYVWITIASGIVLDQAIHEFHTMKVVADYKTGKYIRLILNNQEWDATTTPITIAPTVLFPRLDLMLLVENPGPIELVEYADDVILTQNEP